MKRTLRKALAVSLAVLLLAPSGVAAQSEGGEKPFKPEELDQLLAPIALYPDSLLAQVLMASTYPLEVVQADRWARQNESLEGDALTKALEQKNWDPSIKSLVNFPQVLQMMGEELDWTQKLGDAFLAQQKEVMDTIQKLRKKAKAEDNLKTTQEQTIIVEKETQTIVIESASPEVVYVPTYNPTVVYGTWPYPAYPPYYYYPPGYVAGAALFSFGVGVAVGAAWGYAWGNCNWRGGDVNVNIDRNTNINNNIDRSKYQNKVSSREGGRGSWKHNPEHRKGVSYRDQGTAQKFDRGASRDARSRESFRGRAEAGRRDIARGGADDFKGRSGGGRRDTGSLGGRSTQQRKGSSGTGRQDYAARRDTGSRGGSGAQQRKSSTGLDRSGGRQGKGSNAFAGYDKGSRTRNSSNRGHQSLSSSRSGGSRGSNYSRGAGGGGRSGGRRR